MPVSLHFNHQDHSFDEHARETVLCSASIVSERKQNEQFYIEHSVTDDASFGINIRTMGKTILTKLGKW